jgi:glycerophosphoryl diester phosphodiesterase
MTDSIKIVLLVSGMVAAAAALYLYLLWPARTPAGYSWLPRWKYAHRGLFSRDQSIPENSLTAFDAAIRAGFGFELDVAMTADQQLVVFHDDSPLRMCGVEGKIWAMCSDEIRALRLAGTRERIPLFSDLLSMVHGQVPLIVEIKSSPLRPALCEAVAKALDSYTGSYCVESFDPVIVGWFRKHRPAMLRGQLACRGDKTDPGKRFGWFLLRNLLTNVLARPHFIAYQVNEAAHPAFRLCRRLGALTVAWTVRDEEECATADQWFDAMIFETWEGMPDWHPGING